MLNVRIDETDSIVQVLPNPNLNVNIGDKVVVESSRGIELGRIIPVIDKEEKNKFKPKEIIRLATDDDLKQTNKNIILSDSLINKANKIVKNNKLDMKIVKANYTLDKKQLLFIFVADTRIDFRNLAKEFGTKFKSRIELKQIGIRDKAKCFGGLGICGRTLCCKNRSECMGSVSINMAKNQSLALNPNKINGLCGRLMCCLKYEDNSYTEMKKDLPKIGEIVKTSEGEGKVISIMPCKGTYRVNIGENKIIEVTKDENGSNK